MKFFIFLMLVSLPACAKSASVVDAWNSEKTDAIVGLAVFERIQEMSKIERCKKSSEPWKECYENAQVESGKAFVAIFNAKGLIGDCALVKAYDFFPDTSRGEEIYNELLKRGKRMLPILSLALNNKPCVAILSTKDEASDICLSADTYVANLNKIISDIKAGKKVSPDEE
jgi:hypothetical protein